MEKIMGHPPPEVSHILIRVANLRMEKKAILGVLILIATRTFCFLNRNGLFVLADPTINATTDVPGDPF